MSLQDTDSKLNIADKALDLGKKLLNVLTDKIPLLKANQIFIQEIENNDKLSTSEKMALLYHSSEIKRKIKNLYSVLELTDIMLKGKGSSLETADLDTDSEWFGMFSDIAENVSDEEMQYIWAKILASKCEDKKSVDKKLLSILQVMEYEDAEIFSYICANSVWIKDNDSYDKPAFIYQISDIVSLLNDSEDPSIIFNDVYNKQIVNHSTFNQLQSLGLITHHSGVIPYGISGDDNINLVINYYGDKAKISSTSKKELPLGRVEFTKCGCQLVKILYDGQKENKNMRLMDKIIEYYQKYEFDVQKI